MNLMHNINRLPKITSQWITRNIHQTPNQVKEGLSKKLILEPLTEREVLRVKGDEVVPFLQGLITNDIKHLHPSSNKAIYAMFLNKAGRVLYDTIVYHTSDTNKILIECDKNVANDLKRHLRLYRVRRNIDIDSVDEELKVWQVFDSEHGVCKENLNELVNAADITLTTDPRLKDLGIRLLAGADKTWSELANLFAQQNEVASSTNDNNFRLHRYRLGIAEGAVDMPPGKCFPLEANCDLLNGVSFHKGCYIGQELTARVHHTGMIRKRHMPVSLVAPLPPTEEKPHTVLNETGANCGSILGSLADRALGLLRIENVLKAKELLVNGSPCRTEKPKWWPQELHAKVSIRKDI